jgi:hypothetical protein
MVHRASALSGLGRTGAPCLWLLLAVILVHGGTPGLSVPQSASAQDWAPPRTVFIERSGHTLDGLFLDFWRAQSTLLGDPITEEVNQRTPFSEEEQIVQFFEGAALVYLPEANAGEQVRLLPLGRDLQEKIESTYFTSFQPVKAQLCKGRDDCTLVVRTRHTVQGEFREFWLTETGQLLGAPLSEPFKAMDGRTGQLFENGALPNASEGGVAVRPIGRELADDAGASIEPIEQPADVPAYDPTLFVEPEVTVTESVPPTNFGPGPQQGAAKEIVISVSRQYMWVYENGEVILETYVSTGVGDIPETITPPGHYSIHTKYDVQDMEGILGGEYYFVDDVPYVMYFDNLGNALHGTYWHNNFGAPMSHGCVNLPMDVAAFMYEWAPIGTAVSVIA